MAWTTPPTFSDGAVLSAAQLNILSEDISYLWERAQQVNVARPRVTVSSTDGDDIDSDYFLSHKFETFEWDLVISGGDIDQVMIRLYVNDVLEGTPLNDGTNRATGYEYQGTADISSYGIAVGTLTKVKVTVKSVNPGNVSVLVRKLQEIP